MFILDPDPDFLVIPDPGSRISDPGSSNSNKREGGIFVVLPFFVVTNITKLIIILEILENYLPRITVLFFYQKIVTKIFKIWFGIRDPESRI
jgi:hypothetical protein